jgi:hypothetical protein
VNISPLETPLNPVDMDVFYDVSTMRSARISSSGVPIYDGTILRKIDLKAKKKSSTSSSRRECPLGVITSFGCL